MTSSPSCIASWIAVTIANSVTVNWAVSWIVALCALGCAGDREHPLAPHDAKAPSAPSDGEPLRVLHAYTSAFNRGSLPEVLALMSEDIVLLGIDDCRGIPCVGREAVQDGFLGRDADVFYRDRYAREDLYPTVDGNRVTTHFSTRPGRSRVRGAEHMRGLMRFTIVNGRITRIENMFDLEDPETVVIRHSWGEFTFAERDPATGDLLGRVLLANISSAKTKTIVEVQLTGRAVGRRGLIGRLAEGTCAEAGANGRDIQFAEGLDLEAQVDIPIEQLIDSPFKLELRLGDGTRIACGEVPSLPPK
jgi:hypothetical protein